jgi:signal transduction histidine kinase
MESVSCGAGKPGGWKTRDGELWFPTSGGLVAIDPRIVNINHTSPVVYIEELTADGKPLAWPAAAGAPLRIAPGRNALEFHYTALSFQKPERIRFRYKLDGADLDWIDANTRRAAYYNNLAPGDYSFHVMACNSDGVWNVQGASVDLKLLPHIWQTWWFQLLAVSATLGLVAATARQTTRRRMQRTLERLERQHAIEKERMRIAHDIHDDLGGSLTQITFLGEMAKRDLAKPAEAAAHVNKITESARQTARALDEIVWAVHPGHDRLDHLTLYLWQFAEEFFHATPVRCRVEAPAEMPACFVPADLRHGIYLLVKEAFNNTLKHATASEVRLRFVFDHSVLAISIEDNGRGFVLDPAGRFHNGLDSMKRRVEEFHGQFSLASGAGKGTRLTFTIPLTHAHAN